MHHIPLDKAWRVHVQPDKGWMGCLLRFLQEVAVARGFDLGHRFVGHSRRSGDTAFSSQHSSPLGLRGEECHQVYVPVSRYVDGQEDEGTLPTGGSPFRSILFGAQGTTRKMHRGSSFTSQPDKVVSQYMHVAVSSPPWPILRREDEPGFGPSS